ncbi:MAG: hypothetical protein PUP92_38650, partial [Rhizonema sp. PD38]|nr:hypothetical protein [Rhizonema sp. PD38]
MRRTRSRKLPHRPWRLTMTSAYLVTESETDLTLLRKLLPAAQASDLVFYATKGRSSVYSAAGTLLSDRGRPVVIVVDADTQD